MAAHWRIVISLSIVLVTAVITGLQPMIRVNLRRLFQTVITISMKLAQTRLQAIQIYFSPLLVEKFNLMVHQLKC